MLARRSDRPRQQTRRPSDIPAGVVTLKVSSSETLGSLSGGDGTLGETRVEVDDLGSSGRGGSGRLECQLVSFKAGFA